MTFQLAISDGSWEKAPPRRGFVHIGDEPNRNHSRGPNRSGSGSSSRNAISRVFGIEALRTLVEPL
jgi:hypothetical protein